MRLLAANPASIVGQGSIQAGYWAGVAYGWDSLTAPTTGLLAVHDGVNQCWLYKCVSGVWTVLASSQAVTYVAGVLPQIKWAGSTTYQLFYNGSQVGTNQTVSDAGTGQWHGLFSTGGTTVLTGATLSWN